MRTSVTLRLLAAIALLVAAAPAATACGRDDNGDVSVISPQPEPEPDPEADPDPEAAETPEPGVVEPPPSSATQVKVTLSEWQIASATQTASPGAVYFLVENAGKQAHEFVIIRSGEHPAALVTEEGRVPEGAVDIIDEIEPFTPESSASIVVELEAGSYVPICNIAEDKDGAVESHYENGMSAGFTVS